MKITLRDIPTLQPSHRSAMHKYLRDMGAKCERKRVSVCIENGHGLKDYTRVQKINHFDIDEVITLLSGLETEKVLLKFAKEKILEYLR